MNKNRTGKRMTALASLVASMVVNGQGATLSGGQLEHPTLKV